MTTTTGLKPLLACLLEGPQGRPPIWLMRQAGRYLPEYRQVRAEAGSFLDLCYTPKLATEVTIQPLRRFDLDAAIIFSDILVIPQALGQDLRFQEGEGPKLGPLTAIPSLDESKFAAFLAPVYEALSLVSSKLGPETSLIGFAGAPWTLACYMIDGQGGGGFPEACRMMRERPTLFGQLVDCLVESIVLHLSNQVRAGAEVIQLFDSWAGLLEGNEVTQWSLAPMLRITGELARLHPDVPIILFPRNIGQEGLLTIAEDGRAAGLSLDQGHDLDWAASALQSRITVQGNLSPETLKAGGEALTEETDRILRSLGGGPHIFNLGHGVLQHTPPEHVAALVEQVRSFRS